MQNERRKHERFTISQAIEAKFPKETLFDAVGLDLSEDGIRIEAARHLDPYAKIFILVQTGEGEHDKFYFDGVVAWVEKAGHKNIYGIQITDIDYDSKKHLKEFVKKNHLNK